MSNYKVIKVNLTVDKTHYLLFPFHTNSDLFNFPNKNFEERFGNVDYYQMVTLNAVIVIQYYFQRYLYYNL